MLAGNWRLAMVRTQSGDKPTVAGAVSKALRVVASLLRTLSLLCLTTAGGPENGLRAWQPFHRQATTSWRSDPSEDMVVILLTQASWTSLVPGRVSRDFGILAYQAIDD
jgi:hypothetical protein